MTKSSMFETWTELVSVFAIPLVAAALLWLAMYLFWWLI